MPAVIAPFLWFTDRAEEAVQLYTSVIPGSTRDGSAAIAADSPSGPAGSIRVLRFTLAGQPYMAMNGGPLDPFNRAISLSVHCDDQAELDRIWDGLLAGGGEPERCGWLRDRFGVSWQVVPRQLDEMMRDPDRARAKRVAEAMMTMVKLDLAALQAAHRA